LSEHPNNLGKYEGVFRRWGRAESLRISLRRTASLGLTLVRSLWRSIAGNGEPSLSFPQEIDVLLISHLVSADVRPETPDFYYGTLPEQLASRGVTSLVALHNHVSRGDRRLRKLLTRGGPTCRVVLARWSTWKQELGILRRLRAVASRLLIEASAAERRVESAVAMEASRNATAGAAMVALRMHFAVGQLCARYKPRALLVTWEGHAWERLAFHAARSIDPAIRCVGYQHTVLFPRSHALRRSLGRTYDPDVILTIGDVNREVLRQTENLRGVPVITYGSHRRHPTPRPRTVDASTRCLVIPEGLELECLTLFDFALGAAPRLPDLQFVLRTHPVTPFASLARRHARFRVLPPNVCISDQTDIADDFARCDWALYRGSSAIVHAVLTGVRPVYLERPGQMVIDPLFAMPGWRTHAASIEALGDVVETDRALAADEKQREWEPAKAYCDRYVAPADANVVHALLTGSRRQPNEDYPEPMSTKNIIR
jgi:hypothetical protein